MTTKEKLLAKANSRPFDLNKEFNGEMVAIKILSKTEIDEMAQMNDLEIATAVSEYVVDQVTLKPLFTPEEWRKPVPHIWFLEALKLITKTNTLNQTMDDIAKN